MRNKKTNKKKPKKKNKKKEEERSLRNLSVPIDDDLTTR